MIQILDVAAMRSSDATTIAGGVPGRELMGRAGEGIFRAGKWQPPVAIVCGLGNNAGDGYVVACRLAEAGFPCELLLMEKSFSPDGAYWFQQSQALGVPVRLWSEVDSLASYGSILDCIFGTGFHGQVSGEAARMIDLINQSGAYIVSADINSGLNGNNGLAEKAVRSDLTVSVGWYQPGHFLNQAMDWMATKINCEIGIVPLGPARFLLEVPDVAALFPPRKHFANKGTYGYLGLIGGSLKYSGAIRLAASANAAMRAGAGVVKIAVPRSLCEPLMPLILESTLYPLSESPQGLAFLEEEWRQLTRGLRVIAIGMGMEHTEAIRAGVRFLLQEYEGTLIIDADGLNALSALLREEPSLLQQAKPRVLLTPHPGEFSRLSGASIPEIQQQPLEMAEAFAAEHRVTLLLKGPTTLVTDGQETYFIDRGAPGMATAGSGDVLSGILSALCAGAASLPLAAAAGAWINGRAGELAQEKMGDVSMTASDTIAMIPQVLREIRRE
ncbi:MAG: NAD(P)H-hydrate dehydratase [Clostridia bacterium]|nr:NAD(P)H-hydrate dehydratase [Clostridia bacterium]